MKLEKNNMNKNMKRTSKYGHQRSLPPSLTGRVLGVGLLFACFALFASCGSSNDDDSTNAAFTETPLSEAPVWQVDWSNNQERPDWTEPDFPAIYENWTVLKVQIEDALMPYASEGDLMALYAGLELRALAQPAVSVGTGQPNIGKFVMKVWGNEAGTETLLISLLYYCQKLNHIFTLSDKITLDSDETTGIDKDFIPKFTSGSPKYPVVKTLIAEPLLTKAGITPVDGALVGAFVGEECRGTTTLLNGGGTPLVVYGRSAGETVALKYYDDARNCVYTIANAARLQ